MFAAKTQAIPIICLREDARLLAGQLRFGEDTLAIQDSINVLDVEVNSKLSFDRHLESVAYKASLRVKLLRRVKHQLDIDGLKKLYKAQMRLIMEYSPLTWMDITQSHLFLLNKWQR